VVETIKNEAINHEVAAVVFDDGYHTACDFNKISFCLVSRDANVVACELAREARTSSPSV
jgi:hypothetical protein